MQSLVFTKVFLRASRKSLLRHQETNHSQEGFPQWHHATTTSTANQQSQRFPNQEKESKQTISAKLTNHNLAENWSIDLYSAKDSQVSACDLPLVEFTK